MTPNEAQPLHKLPPTADILSLYERAIAGCRRGDARVVDEVLLELIESLNFQYEQAALGFFRIYDYCLRKVRQRQFEVAQETFEDLRQALVRPRPGLDRPAVDASVPSGSSPGDGEGIHA